MINLTPHPITIRAPQGDITLQPSGTIARVSMDETMVGTHALGVPVITRKSGHVTGIPRDDSGTPLQFIVSSMVLDALPVGTPNVFAPDSGPTAIREGGQVIAVTRLVSK